MQISVIDLSIHCHSDHGKKTNSFNPLRSLAKNKYIPPIKKLPKHLHVLTAPKKKKNINLYL